jgi:hypothetical protein
MIHPPCGDDRCQVEALIRNTRGQRYMSLRARAGRTIAAAATNIPADLRLMTDEELDAEHRRLGDEIGAPGTTAIEAWEAAYRLPHADREAVQRDSAIIRRMAGCEAEIGRRRSAHAAPTRSETESSPR